MEFYHPFGKEKPRHLDQRSAEEGAAFKKICLAQEVSEGARTDARRLRCEGSGNGRGTGNKEDEMRGRIPRLSRPRKAVWSGGKAMVS